MELMTYLSWDFSRRSTGSPNCFLFNYHFHAETKQTFFRANMRLRHFLPFSSGFPQWYNSTLSIPATLPSIISWLESIEVLKIFTLPLIDILMITLSVNINRLDHHISISSHYIIQAFLLFKKPPLQRGEQDHIACNCW